MNFTLIGMPAVGKSYFGKKVAERLKLGFVDIDDLIKERVKTSLQEVIDKQGDKAFGKLEEQTILDLCPEKDCIISPGGSVIYSENAMNSLKKHSKIIFLDEGFEALEKRLSNRDSRAIVGLKNKTFKQLFDKRRPLYLKHADIVIPITTKDTTETVIEKIIEKIKASS